MKKKFFSSLLMGALVATTLGTVTSCKDYDDDINNLQEQISKLATKDDLSNKVSELQGLISANSSAISNLQNDLKGKATLEEVKTLLADYATKKYVDDADATLEAAIKALQTKDIAELKAAIETAQQAADKAGEDAAANKAALDAALKQLGAGFDETNTVAAAIAAVKAQLGTANTELEGLDSRLDAVEAALNDAGDGSLTELAQKVLDIESDLKDIIGEYTTMVTDVDLYVTNASDYRNGLPNNTLSFIFLDQEKTTKFPAVEGVADAQIEFSADNKNVTTTDSLVVRVSPTNAELTASNISLINSQGVELSDLVEVADVKPYKNLITTRSASQGNGLWMVTFKVKEGADAAKLAEEVAVKRGDKSYKVKYAVAVKNTESTDTRRVVSAYNVNVIPADYEPAKSDILVDNRDGIWFNVKDVHNRFEYFAANKSYRASSANEDGNPQYKNDVPEYKWKNEPQIAGTKSEMVIAANDARVGKKLIDATIGKDININVASILNNGQPEDENVEGTGDPYGSNATGATIKGFYVTLDKDFAIESNPSEWNAWKKYAYTNVGIPSGDSYAKPAKLFTGKQGYISIDDEDAIGDVIGFRVYVVNLDGTLVDPDGRAFYVYVDKQKETAKLTDIALDATLKDNKAFDGSNYFSKNVELTEDVFEGTDYTNISDAIGYMEEGATRHHAGEWILDINPSAYGNNVVEPVYRRDYTITYVKADGKTETTNPADAKYAKVNILEPTMFLDNATYAAHTTLYRTNGTEVRTISVEFSKQLPTEIHSLAWVKNYDPTKQVFTNTSATNGSIYKLTAGSTPEAIKLTDKMDNLAYGAVNGTSKYTLYFKDVESKPEKTAEATANQYLLRVEGSDIDTKTRTIDYSYNFGKISLAYNYETAQYTKSYYTLNSTAAQQLKMNFNSWIDFENIAWAENGEPTVTYRVGYDNVVTPIYVGSIAADPTEIPMTVKYNNGAAVKEYIVYGYTMADGTTKMGIEVPVETTDGSKLYYLDLTGGFDPNAILPTGALIAPNAFGAIQSRKPVWTTTVPGSTMSPNAIYAWNPEVANYDLYNNSIFGTSEKKVAFTGLEGTYFDNVKVSFSEPTLFAVAYSHDVITFTQKTYTVNPATEGTLTIKAKDCFGHEKAWNLKVKIAK